MLVGSIWGTIIGRSFSVVAGAVAAIGEEEEEGEEESLPPFTKDWPGARKE